MAHSVRNNASQEAKDEVARCCEAGETSTTSPASTTANHNKQKENMTNQKEQSLSKNGIVFVTLMLLIAIIGGTVSVLITGFMTLVLSMYGLKKAFDWLSNHPEVKEIEERLNTVGYVFNVVAVPRELVLMEQFLITQFKQRGDKYVDVLNRFLVAINVHDGAGYFPDYLYNGMTKKMMWEYRKKYGNLYVPMKLKDFLTEDEILQPVPPDEKNEFHRFCLANNK